jgi:hypothetical protein
MQILKASPPHISPDQLRSPKSTVCQVKARVFEACAVIQSRLVTIYLLALCSEPVPARVSQKQVGGLNALACYDILFVFTQETGSERARLDLDKDRRRRRLESIDPSPRKALLPNHYDARTTRRRVFGYLHAL